MDYKMIDAWAGKARAGDKAAVEVLLGVFRPLLLSSANHYQAAGYTFDDALQDMRLAFLEGIARYEPERATGFAGFIRGYLSNSPRNAKRKRDRQAVMEEPIGHKKGSEGELLSMIERLVDTAVDLEGDYVCLEQRSRLREALRRLTKEQQCIIAGHYGYGLSLKKLAQTTGMAYSTLQRRHVTVIKRLREILEVTV